MPRRPSNEAAPGAESDAAPDSRSAPSAGEEPRWSVYLVRRSDGALYTGIATDVARRFEQHQEGRGAKALRGRGPLELTSSAAVGDRSRAQRVETLIKRLPKDRKEHLAADAGALDAFVRGVDSGEGS